jgi:hypothetical protein
VVRTDEAQETFGGSTAQQLNWKPSTDLSSVAQCLASRIFEKRQVMPEPVSPLMLEFLTFISSHHRTYIEVMEVWRSSCPRHTVWEDALADGLIEVVGVLDQSEVVLTVLGATILEANQKPQLMRSGGNIY